MICLKKIYLILFLIISWSICSKEKPVIAIYQMSNPSEIPWIDNMGNTVNDVVALTLSLMNNYEVIRLDENINISSVDDLKLLSTEMGYDDIIFGECLIVDDGFRFSIRIYDRFKDSMTIETERDIESVMDSFEAADYLVNVLLEGLSGVRVNYGSLKLSTLRADPYRTEINKVDMGYGFNRIDKLITGNHIIEIYQDRGEGEILISTFNINLKEDDNYLLPSVVPWFTASQSETMDNLDRSIASLGGSDNRINSSKQYFDQALEFSSTPFMEQFRPKVIQHYKNWFSYFTSPYVLEADFQESIKIINYRAVKEFPFTNLVDPYKTELSTTLPQSSRIFIQLQKQEINRAKFIPEFTNITLDGKADDWDNIKTSFKDTKSNKKIIDNEILGEDQDLVWFGVATDGKNLYVAIQTFNKKFSPLSDFNFHFTGQHILSTGFDPESNSLWSSWVENKNWNDSISLTGNDIKIKGGEIFEMSIPLNYLADKTLPGNNGLFIELSVKEKDGNMRVDSLDMRILLPDLYYSLQ
ncbi:MAG: hypothetical protein OCD02_17915 [Spirochaetaceae bacterium]